MYNVVTKQDFRSAGKKETKLSKKWLTMSGKRSGKDVGHRDSITT